MKLLYKLIEKLYCALPNNLAYIDQVTGCYNRNYYEREVLLEGYKYHGFLIVVDINGLKNINDTLGHTQGTAKIISISSILKQLFNKGKVIRIGGDEFIILTKIPQLGILKDHTLDFSYGCTYKKEGENFLDAYDRADKNLYEMKKEYYLTHNRRK